MQDAEQYREVRLESLRNHPDSFASSYEEEKTLSLKKFQERLSMENAVTFGAWVEENLIGIITIYRETKQKRKHIAWIVGLYVTPSKRGLSVGKHLLKAGIQQAKDWADIEQIYLEVATHNTAAKRLYTSQGFTKFGTEKRALKIGNTYLDEEQMVYFLNPHY